MLRRIALSLMLFVPAMANSAGLPKDYPTNVMYEGKISAIDQAHFMTFIGDNVFRFTPETVIYRPDGLRASAYDLAEGQRVGCNFTLEEEPYVLTDVWILPEGMTFSQ